MSDAPFYGRNYWSFSACNLFFSFLYLHIFYIHLWPIFLLVNGFWSFIAACCNHNSSKSSLSAPSYCTTYYLELWPLSLSLSYSTYGTDTNSKCFVLCLTLLCFMMLWIAHFPVIRTINTWKASSPMVMMLKAMMYNQRIQIESVDYISDIFSSIKERSGCWGQNCLTTF